MKEKNFRPDASVRGKGRWGRKQEPSFDGGDTPTPPEPGPLTGKFAILVGHNDDDAFGFHVTSDGSDDYGSLTEMTINGLQIRQFRYLKDGSRDLKLLFVHGDTPQDSITLKITRQSDGMSITETLAVQEDNRYTAVDNSLEPFFTDGETLVAEVV